MIINRLRRALDGASRAFAVGQIYRPVEYVPDLPVWMHGNPFGLNADEMRHGDAFEQVPIIHAIVRLIQNDCANLPRRFYDGKREVKRKFGNVVDVWSGGNDRDTGHEFRINLFGDLELYGNAFIYLERGRNRKPPTPPYAVWTLNPALVKIVPAPNRSVEKYLWMGADEPRDMPPWSIIHVKKYAAKDDLTGTTWVEPAREDWLAQWYALRIMRQFFARGGISPGTWAPDSSGGAVKALTEPEIRKFQNEYAKRFQSVESLWRLVVMPNMKQIEKGQSIADLHLDDMIMLNNANLCRAAGVPPWMLGIKESGSLDQGKSSETSSENYWRSTIGNPVRLVDDVFSERFCPLFPDGEGVVMETDFDEVPALQKARLEMMTGAVVATGSPVVSVNESREWWGDDPSDVPEHDVVGGPAAADRQAALDALNQQEQPPAPSAATAASTHMSPDAVTHAASGRQHEQRLRKRQEQRLAREEKKLAAEWGIIRTEQERFALSIMNRKMADVDVDPNSLYMGVTEDQKARLERVIRDAMEAAAVSAADEIGAAVAIDLWLQSVAPYIQKRTGVMIAHVTATDREQLRDLIAKALLERKGVSEIQGIVRAFFDGRRGNAMTIARTEIAGPYNRAQFDTWKAGGVRRKWWLTMEDDAVRPSHVRAGNTYTHGSSIGISEAFVLYDSGGHAHGCQVPGETGVAELDINCRCQIMPDLEHFEGGVEAARPTEKPAWANRVFAPKKWSEKVFAMNGDSK